MQFSCGKCATRYSVPDDRVRGKRVRTKCRKCGGEIVLEGPPAGDAPPAADPASAGPTEPPPPPPVKARPEVEERWTVAREGDERRLMTTAEVVQAHVDGELGQRTLVWKDGMDAWKRPFDVPALALGLEARGVKPSPTTSPPPPGAPTSPVPSLEPATRAAPAAQNTNWDDDEATRVVDSSHGHPLLDPPSAPVTAPPPAESSSHAFTFEDEATAVIAPDRAKALLDAEAARSTAEASETPLSFGFDDEARHVVAPDGAAPLAARPPAAKGSVRPPAFPTSPIPAAGVPATPRRESDESVPSVVVSRREEEPARQAERKAEGASPSLPVLRQLTLLQNEPTRVVRVRRRRGPIFPIVIVVVLALLAAAGGGFLASRLLDRRASPALHAP